MTSSHDTHDTGSGHGADEGAHAADHGVGVEGPPTGASERTTPLSAFIWPAIIALLALVLVWGPVTRSFDRFSGAPAGVEAEPTADEGTPVGVDATLTVAPAVTGNDATVIPMPTTVLTSQPTNVQTGGDTTAVPATAAPADTATAAPVPTDTAVPAPPTDAPAASATPAAVAPPTDAEIRNGTPRTVSLGGKSFRVEISNTVLPDWIVSKDPSVASWVSSTVINYVLGVSYSPENADLFAGLHAADTIRLGRADGSAYTFVVDQARRVARTDTRLMEQDHPAITLFLVGDPANDRAVVQGHFTEAATP
ncbi:MAG TPA: hypothetical protein VM536_19650 [Chloroflexia bacterium]|nr:hypothetical protein [Chloroflexia bacterium]